MFNVLLSLADSDKHGYAILKEVDLSTGTLYAIIKRLLADGFITEVTARPAIPNDDQRRRYYRLTPEGRAVAIEEALRMEKLLDRARSKDLIRALKPI